MFNEKIVIFTLPHRTYIINNIFRKYCLKNNYEKSLKKLLNYGRRKNALIFCEDITNLNGVLSCVFNNLHLKIEIIKFL